MYRIITTMDGVPITQAGNSLTQYLNTKSCRDNAKHLTYTTGTRHHSRGLTKDQYYTVCKEYRKSGHISVSTLGRRGDHH